MPVNIPALEVIFGIENYENEQNTNVLAGLVLHARANQTLS